MPELMRALMMLTALLLAGAMGYAIGRMRERMEQSRKTREMFDRYADEYKP